MKNIAPFLAKFAFAMSVAALSVGCVGDASTGSGGSDAGGMGDGGIITPDPGLALNVSGALYDYEEATIGGQAPIGISGATLTTEGLEPQATVTTGAEGDYVIGDVPEGSIVGAVAALTDSELYRPTRNALVSVLGEDVSADQYLVADAFVIRNHNAVLDGAAPTLGLGVIFADLVRNNGEPLTGALLEDVTLVDAEGLPAAAQGPYFFGAGGVMDLEVIESVEAPIGRARVGFLEVEPGTYTLRANYLSGQGEIKTLTAPVIIEADGATLGAARGVDDDGAGGGNGGGGGADPLALSFSGRVYPMLQRSSQGGLGCATCHGGLDPAAGVAFDLPLDEVYALVVPALVDLVAPIESLLLTKPLLNSLEAHPNKTFASIEDPTYLSWLEWIEAGAPLAAEELPAGGGGNGGGNGGQ